MKNIYVGNLSPQTTSQDLEAVFRVYGQVAKVNIVRDHYTGEPRGFAFVEMPVASEADKAIMALNGTELGGRRLTVNEARPREERSGTRSGFGGRRQRRW